MRSKDEIAAEAQKLRDMRDTVRETTAFGDNNREAIDAQIEVLEKGIDEDKLYDLHDGAAEDEMFGTQHDFDSALAACQWVTGEEDEAPSDDWQSLVQ